MKPIYKRYLKTVALVWLGCLVLFLIIYAVVLVPQKRHKKQIEEQLAKEKQAYNFVLKAVQEETRIRLNEQLEKLRRNLSDFVIDFEDSANLTLDISQIANEKNISSFSIRNRDNRGATELPDCKYISENYIDISFAADFNQFAAFLNALERHRPVLFVNDFKISRSNSSSICHDVTMSLAVFVRKKQDG